MRRRDRWVTCNRGEAEDPVGCYQSRCGRASRKSCGCLFQSKENYNTPTPTKSSTRRLSLLPSISLSGLDIQNSTPNTTALVRSYRSAPCCHMVRPRRRTRIRSTGLSGQIGPVLSRVAAQAVWVLEPRNSWWIVRLALSYRGHTCFGHRGMFRRRKPGVRPPMRGRERGSTGEYRTYVGLVREITALQPVNRVTAGGILSSQRRGCYLCSLRRSIRV